MFKFLFFTIIISILIACQLEVPSEVNSSRFTIAVPDKNLVKAINLQLKKSVDAPIYYEDIDHLRSLDGNNRGIVDLTGIKYFKNITKLKFANNQISNLSQLASLNNLDTLDLTNNQVSDIQPLAQLTKLKQLVLTNNRVYELNPLKNLLNIKDLFLDYNKISQISALKTNCEQNGLNAGDYINLKFNRLDSISVQADLNYLISHQVFVEYDSLKKSIIFQ